MYRCCHRMSCANRVAEMISQFNFAVLVSTTCCFCLNLESKVPKRSKDAEYWWAESVGCNDTVLHNGQQQLEDRTHCYRKAFAISASVPDRAWVRMGPKKPVALPATAFDFSNWTLYVTGLQSMLMQSGAPCCAAHHAHLDGGVQ